ncbi:MAG TPA: WD40 repeat domain-containing protein, partial [Baekduia sp.]
NATTGALVTTWKPCIDEISESGDFDSNTVFALGLSGSTLYVGGDFGQAGTVNASGLCATTALRNNAAAFSTAAGSAVSAWDPDLDDEVRAVLPNAAGSLVYLGGRFTHVGATLIPRLAVVGASTGAASTGWAPKADNTVFALALGTGGTVYAGGQFTTIGSNQLARASLAEISGTGIAIAAFDAHLHGRWSAGAPTVDALATGGSPQRLYVGGYFDRGADGALADLAAADPTTGALDGTFDPAPGGSVLAIAVGATRLVAGGDFQSVGTQPHPGAVALDGDGHPKPSFVLSDPGAIQRMVLSPDGSTIYAIGQWPSKQLAAFDATTGQERPFAPTPDGQVEAIALSPDGRTLYLGGNFDQVDGQERKDLAAVTTSDGSLTAWKPEPDGAVAALATDGSTVYAGGDFTHIGTSIDARSGLAALSASTGDVTAWNPSPNGYVNVIAPAPDGTHVYVAGAFTSIGTSPQTRGGVAELTVGSGNPTPFNPNPTGHVNDVVPTADGNTVYVSGQITAIGAAAAGQLGRVESGAGYSTQWVDDLPDTYGGFPSFDADGDTVWLGTMTSPSDGRKNWVQYTSAPVVAAAPGLAGAPAVGVAVGCADAVWRNAPAEVTTSWTLDGAPIAEASGESYTPVAGDVGRRLACVQEGRNSAGSASAASAGQAVAGGPTGGGGGAPGGGAAGGGGPGAGGGAGGPALPGGGTPKPVAAKPPTLKVHVKTPAKARKGISLAFTLSTPATVSVAIQRVRPGRLVGKKCHAPGKHPHGKACKLLSAAGSASWKSGTKKTLTVVLRRLKGKALTAGTYRATFTARVGTGPRSKAVTETIRVR